jgi:diguanylate cyclase (GGDEF)-like protein
LSDKNKKNGEEMEYDRSKVIASSAAVTVFLAITLFSVASILIGNIKDIVITEASEEAKGIAATAARFIEDNVSDYRKLSAVTDYSKGSFDKNYYQRMNKLLRRIKKDTGADFVFTEKKISDTEIEYILDGEDPESDLFSPIGSKDGMSKEELRAFNEGIITATGMIKDEAWGDYLTAFAPIKDSGELIGLVGVDFSSDYIKKIVNNVSYVTYLILFLLTALSYIAINNLFKIHYSSLNTDFMTGLINRRGFKEAVHYAISDAKRYGITFTLIILDIDNFKEINDRCGHPYGDKILNNIAHIIKQNTRHSDLSFRYGGDEFAMILPGTSKEDALLVCRNIQHSIAEDRNFSEDNCHPTMSIGICEWSEEITADEMIKAADDAMYLSKDEGKDRIKIC